MFPDFSALQSKIEMFETFLIAIATKIDTVEKTVVAVHATVNEIKALPAAVSGAIDTDGAIAEVLTRTADVLATVTAIHGVAVQLLPKPEAPADTLPSDQG